MDLMIASRHSDLVFGGVAVDEALDDSVGGIMGAGVNDLNLTGLRAVGDFGAFAIENQGDADTAGVLVRGENFDEMIASEAWSLGVDTTKIWPGKNDAMTVDKQGFHGGEPPVGVKMVGRRVL